MLYILRVFAVSYKSRLPYEIHCSAHHILSATAAPTSKDALKMNCLFVIKKTGNKRELQQ